MKRFLTAIAAMMAATAVSAAAPVPDDRFLRFAPEIEALARHDQDSGSMRGAPLFVGSSSIRLWDIPHSFPKIGALNRGFGGATTPDVLHYYSQLIAEYQPAAVVVYVGENDLAAGADPRQVAADVLTLLAKIRQDLPHARIAFLSIKPSPSRWTLWHRMALANAAIKSRSATGGFDYLDVGSALLTAQGVPDKQYFRPDGLHLNNDGYLQWTRIVDAYLKPPSQPEQKAAATTFGAS